ncbi:MAG: class I tRNA ligase family protein [Candidatus Jorgensenbacteria bacterium]|nr:class I tRNA ligase family protein [Candidatus Jorgensenbacteria bacterium]
MLRNLKQFSLPELEEKVLEFWKTNNIFEKSLEKNRTSGKKFVFYEGPPTANGHPGLHHVLARAFKDIILRYKTMRGYYVPRKSGWDTHGLPVEIEVEKALGLKSKKEVEQYGIAEFNAKCKESVWKYKDEWEKLTERMGFWLDLKHPYITYDNRYMESVWYLLKEIWKKKLIYKGHKVVPWCTRCGTVLSSHEVAQGYKETEDTSVYIKFKLKIGQKIGGFTTDDKTYILAWTTTPWTLPGNVALAVGKDISYSVVLETDGLYIVATHLLVKIFTGEKVTLYGGELKGKDLIGASYKPLFDVPALKNDRSYRIYPADFVTTNDGTGVVHIAPMYGEDDYNLGKKEELLQFHTVGIDGRFLSESDRRIGVVEELAGKKVKTLETDALIFEYLKKQGNFFKTEKYAHEYPHCWRCDSPLIYYARGAWFIAMSKLKNELISSNKNIKWIPGHLREGRFGEWLRDAKDWAISRERYWGTPLPIWECDACGETHAVGSIQELVSLQETKKKRNHYFFVRHGEAQNNKLKICSAWPDLKHHLTLKGVTQAERAAKKLAKEQKIDYIVSSDITRAKETAQIFSKALKTKIVLDKRLREINIGDFHGRGQKFYGNYYTSDIEKFTKPAPNGETLTDVRARIYNLILDLEKKYSGKNILLVSHEYPIWMGESILNGWTNEEAVEHKKATYTDFLANAEVRDGEFLPLPRNVSGAGDLHKPYIDAVKFKCPKCKKGTMKRIPEVLDVWFDAGSMPFSQAHWPFENKDSLDFPAEYICEAVDQTRGWFYTLLAISVLMGRGEPYRNVISLGHILDKNGQKMSKSKGNIIDPWEMAKKYGIDAVRWHFYTMNPPGEPKRIDDADFGKVMRQFILLAYNSFVFWKTYGKENSKLTCVPKSKNILDAWVVARLNETVSKTTKLLDAYEIGDAARVVQNFVEDVSRWYIRRSRRRFQHPDSIKDYESASQTLGFVLIELSKLLAPFVPFFADTLYKSFNHGNTESVHLDNWSAGGASDKKLLHDMAEVRRLSSIALAKRAGVGVKVRQPLAELKIADSELWKQRGLMEILKDEVNVKKVSLDKKLKDEIALNTNITIELREEGLVREFVRMIQDLRQSAKLEPKDKIIVMVSTQGELEGVVRKYESIICKEVNAKDIVPRREQKFSVEIETKFENTPLWIGARKV